MIGEPINSTSELDELPDNSIVLDYEGDAWKKDGYEGWVCTGYQPEEAEIRFHLPVSLLYEGEEVDY